MGTESWHIWVDTGGTFTDCIAQSPDGSLHYRKVLSNSSLRGSIGEVLQPNKIHINQQWNVPDGFINGLELELLDLTHSPLKVKSFQASDSTIVLEESVSGKMLKPQMTFAIHSPEEAPILACRLVTGTLPSENLPPIELRLATTKGTNALLEKNGAPTLLLITKGFRDLLQIGNQKRPNLFSFQVEKSNPLYDKVIEIPERLDAKGGVLDELLTDDLPNEISDFLDQTNASVAVSLMHSYQNNQHEQQLHNWLANQGANHISCSSEMSSLIKLLPRTQTAVINAYLDPVLQDYLNAVKASLSNENIFVMNSAAGLSSSDDFNPKDSLLSGPAGGVIGAASIGKESGQEQIISLDMGGTSTDVARYDGQFDYQFEHTVGDATIKAPALSIETVAAGGGSICSFDGQRLTVGPESAGADPGPACYGAGGPLTLTDINLLSGRLERENFQIPISQKAAEHEFQKLMDQLRASRESSNRKQVLLGLLQIANERMAEAIKKISLRKGYAPSDYSLVAFGGAGAQHATAIASLLDMHSVLIPRKAGLLSAQGLGEASIESFAEQQVLQLLDNCKEQINRRFEELEQEAREKLKTQLQNSTTNLKIRRQMIFMRLEGQEATLEIEFSSLKDLYDDFKQAYQNRYGHWIEDRNIEIESLRVVAAINPGQSPSETLSISSQEPNIAYKKTALFSDGKRETAVYRRYQLKAGHQLTGPAIVLDPHNTIVIEPGWSAELQINGTLALTKEKATDSPTSSEMNETINLELFTNRFTSIAEKMGEMMRRTALSVNIKERLDYSCALLNSKGELVVNAPHIPVHLGALGMCVRRLQQTIDMEPGDVVVTNHPHYGGSHLPDITVVTPIFTLQDDLLGYAACRAHHAEIGGARPGSMPPKATSLVEEGVVIPPTYLVKEGKGQWQQIRKILTESDFPSRAVEENLADLRAAVASNQQGVKALCQLAADEGVDRVKQYMAELKTLAAKKTTAMISDLPNMSSRVAEFLDDQTKLSAHIEKRNKELLIDFTGTAGMHPGNLNATPAIVQSVVMYVVRCLVDEPIPLNEGLLDPIEITLPSGILNPDFGKDPQKCPAVVGGNTETSQRLVDLLLKPFEKMACSQGTMNNIIFGNESYGYYETIGGGTGAGPNFDGCDAVHHHMTNTAGTDPEILEHRYPVRLKRYEIRQNSGGNGKFEGGNGISRELRFLEPASLSVLTQHRVTAPYGLRGGKPGKSGKQLIIRENGQRVFLDAIDEAELHPGDRLLIHTPGGGGFGSPPKKSD